MELLSTQSIQESEDRNKTSTTSSLYLQNNVCFGFRNLFPRDILFSSSFWVCYDCQPVHKIDIHHHKSLLKYSNKKQQQQALLYVFFIYRSIVPFSSTFPGQQCELTRNYRERKEAPKMLM